MTTVDRASPLPAYFQVAQDLRRRIAAAEWRTGGRLPSEPALGREYGVSRVTIRQALAELVKDDLLERKRGSGTYVRPVQQPIVWDLNHCVIHVTDWERANAFYGEVMGAELIDRGGGTWAYRFGRQQLNVHGPGVHAEPLARVPVAPGNSDLCFVWDGPIDGAVAHLERHGIAVELGPVPRRGAQGPGTSVYFRDPDGSLLEFISYER